MKTFDREISDYAVSVFLRYFRRGMLTGAEYPHVEIARDRALLLGQWAISEPVRTFLGYVTTRRHEAQSLLQFERRMDDAVARGRIDAQGTLLSRKTTGHPSLVMYHSPVRSYDTGPNQVVAWVARAAGNYATWLFALQAADSAYLRVVEGTMAKVAAMKRLDSLREILKLTSGHRRPAPEALRDAARSRRMIYRLAVAAYDLFARIESGDEDALANILHGTLMGPLEPWRRFEMAVALAIGEALATETGEETSLALIGKSTGTPIITCGRYDIFWQSGGGHFTQPPPEPSETRLMKMLKAYGLQLAADRPDLVIVDRRRNRAIGIVEVKYLAGDTSGARFREAAGQIVRYAHSYAPETGIDDLIRASLIAMNREAPMLLDESAVAPQALDFEGLRDGRLNRWVRERLLAAAP